jgi:hypothetical protein
MRTKVTLLLVFLNLCLFFFIFKIMPRMISTEQLKQARTRVLPATAADIQAIEISSGGQSTRLIKRGDLWHLSSPIDWPANPHAVSRILTDLQFLKHETSFEVSSLKQNKLSLADYGLEKPVITVTLTPNVPRGDTGGQPAERIVLRIGNPTDIGNHLYVLSPDGQRVHVVARSLAESLSIPLDQLRSSALFNIPEFEVRSFNLQIAAPSNLRVHVRREGNRWFFETPVAARAKAAAVKLALSQLHNLRVGSFLSQPPPPELSPVTTPVFRISLGGNNRSETLLIGGAVPQEPAKTAGTAQEFFAQIDGKNTLFTLALSPELVELLRSAQDKLRETRILEFDPSAISTITLRAPNQTELSLKRLEGASGENPAQWQIVRRDADKAPSTLAADPGVVKDLLDALVHLSALKFLRDAPTSADEEAWGFNSPEREVLLQAENGAGARSAPNAEVFTPATQTLQIGVGSERGPRAYARLDSARYVYEIDSEILRKLPLEAVAWRDRRLRELPAGARITMLRLSDLNTKQVLLERSLPAQSAETETLVPAETTAVQKEAWTTLLTHLRTLRARNFVLDHFAESVTALGEEHRWRYKLELGISLNGGAGAQTSIQELMITERLGGGLQIAGASDLNSVFELEQALVDALWTLAYQSPAQEALAREATPPAKP